MEETTPCFLTHSGSKRGPSCELEAQSGTSTSGSASTSQSILGSPTVNNKRCKAQQQQHQGDAAGVSQFPVLDYHLQQCQHAHGAFYNNALQPADSSTWSNWQQLQPIVQLDHHMGADSQQPQQLSRANSAPELVKLTQADSTTWQQAHASTTGGVDQPMAAVLLSHKDYWVI